MKKSLPRHLVFVLLSFIAALILLEIPLWRTLSAADLSRGKILYDAHCAACHGNQGDGRGLKANDRNPPPTDFTSSAAMAQIPFDVNEQAVAQGKGTGMPGFGSILSSEEIQNVIAYQRGFLK